MLRFDMSMNVDNIMPLALLEEKVDRCYQSMEDYYNYNGGLGIRILKTTWKSMILILILFLKIWQINFILFCKFYRGVNLFDTSFLL